MSACRWLLPRLLVLIVCAGLLALVTTTARANVRTFTLPNGSKVSVDRTGIGTVTSRDGRHSHVITLFRALDQGNGAQTSAANDYALYRELIGHHSTPYAPGRVLVVFATGVVPTGAAAPTRKNPNARRAETSDGALNVTLRSIGARSMSALLPQSFASSALSLNQPGRPSIYNTFVLDITGGADPKTAAATLKRQHSVVYAEPDWYVSGMSTEPRLVPKAVLEQAQQTFRHTAAQLSNSATPLAQTLPTNFGTVSSLQSYLNANGVDLYGAYAEIARKFSQLPGQGEIISNVSVGDLTDQSMADAGDPYVQANGPTTVVMAGQRYLDIPAMPLIPTFTSDPFGFLDPLGTTEGLDPNNVEVLLDLSMMAPLPHDRQRPGAVGVGGTDLLGIAPGAQYRLIIPQTPTISQIEIALMAAAQQQPRPNVISASLGFGFDTQGFPGRYLEEDPVAQAIITTIVHDFGIVVCVAANDGLRAFTNAAVGPDGGSAATDLADLSNPVTSPADDFASTIPGEVLDSGAVTVGGLTTDDIFAVPLPPNGSTTAPGTFVETRYDGETDFSSGFGSRLNIAAPSDNIPTVIHICAFNDCTAQSLLPIVVGGTSASAPMTAAASAVLLQVARLTGRSLTPKNIRGLLVASGRQTHAPPQADRRTGVGPELDLTAAVEKLLGANTTHSAVPAPAIVRLGIAERQNLGNFGAQFLEVVNPDNINMQGPTLIVTATGQNTVSPITFAPDIVGLTDLSNLRYQLRVGNKVVSTERNPRLMPAQLLAAAQLPLASASARSLTVSYDVFRGMQKLTSVSRQLTFGPDDGTYQEALAPIVPPVVAAGQDVVARYDVNSVRGYANPHLIVSSIDHWSATAGLFRVSYDHALGSKTGTAVIPASAFASGEGVYGVSVFDETTPATPTFGEFSPIRIGKLDFDDRAAAPTLSLPQQPDQLGHFIMLRRTTPEFDVHYDVSNLKWASNAIIEISAPAPGFFGSFNSFTNPNGSQRDDNGIDSPSMVFLPQFGRSGTAHLNALSLGLQSSDIYQIRALPGNGDRVVGQASASDSIEFDDGLAPGGQEIYNFDIHPGAYSSIATAAYGAFDFPVSAFAYSYSPASGIYGPPLAGDPTGNSLFQVLGTDANTHRNFVLQSQLFTPQQDLQTYDTRTGQLLRDQTINNAQQYFITATWLDDVRHRFDFLVYAGADGSDEMVTAPLATLALSNPIPIDVNTPRAGVFSVFSVDESTGNVVASSSRTGALCFLIHSGITAVNLSTRSATSFVPIDGCTSGIVSDNGGHNAFLTYGDIGEGGIFPPGILQQVNEQSLAVGPKVIMPQRGLVFPAYDALHHVIVAGFIANDKVLIDNNGASLIAVIDPQTGRILKTLRGFNFIRDLGTAFQDPANQGIVLDPPTRTGWTFGPGNAQLQEFHY